MNIAISSSDAAFYSMAARLCEKYGCTVVANDADAVLADAENPAAAYTAGVPVISATFFPSSDSADIVLARPFTFAAFASALNAVSRPPAAPAARTSEEKAADYVFADDGRTVNAPGIGEVVLTAREYETAKLLFGSRPEPVSRERLLEEVFPDSTASNTADVYINYLRAKFTPLRPIVTVRGVGYRWDG